MAKELSYQPLPNFGVNGLNTQSNPSSLDPSWLTTANNIVLRESGRISFRKGFKQKVVPSGTAIGSLVEHHDQAESPSVNKIFASHGTSIYRMDFTSPNAAFPTTNIDVKHTVANSTGDWQFVNFNDRLHCFHEGIIPQRYDGSAASLQKWSTSYHTDAINIANGSTITDLTTLAATKTYKITTLGATAWDLVDVGYTGHIVNDIFTASIAGSAAIGESIALNKMIEGNRYKIINLGDSASSLTASGADGSPAVDEIFTANDVLGTGTGLVAEVLSGSGGEVEEIKTNPTLTTITVDDTTSFPSAGKIIIDEEIISYTGKTSTTFTGCTRGSSGTTATHHLDDAVVTNNFAPPTVTAGEFKPSCGAGFYGRMWVGGVEEEKDVLHYSALLDGTNFTLYAGGGSIDLKKVWDNDEIVAIAPFYGMLAVFGKNNIALYESPDVIGSIKLNEVIRGVGCVARDSVQNIGDDLVFLSATGIRSLARTTEKDKVPLMDISQNIKDTLIRNIGASDLTKVRSVYVENEGIYILSFTDKGINYVFDFKHFTPNKVPRITTWTFDLDREPASMAYTELYSGLLVGQKDGSIAGYEGYHDVDLAWDSGVSYTNAAFTSDIASIWIALGQSMSSALLKRLILVLEGGSGAILYLKWYKDFGVTPSSITSIELRPATTGSTALWGASSSLYGATTVSHTHDATVHPTSSLYTPIYGLQEYKTPLTGSAKHLKLSMAIESNGYDASIQDLSLLHKEGKIR